jgi:hypothetical protein
MSNSQKKSINLKTPKENSIEQMQSSGTTKCAGSNHG